MLQNVKLWVRIDEIWDLFKYFLSAAESGDLPFLQIT